jgi:hypothetical protein
VVPNWIGNINCNTLKVRSDIFLFNIWQEYDGVAK